MRDHVNRIEGPLTTEPSNGEPICGALGFGPVGTTTEAGEYGPQPSPLHAATITDARPAGTGSVRVVPLTCFEATVSAPPPGAHGDGWMTCTGYQHAPATALQLE